MFFSLLEAVDGQMFTKIVKIFPIRFSSGSSSFCYKFMLVGKDFKEILAKVFINFALKDVNRKKRPLPSKSLHIAY